MEITQSQIDDLREAFRCVVSLAGATPKDNKTTCGCYSHIGFKPDERTIEETRISVQLYLNTWVIPKMESALGFDSHLTSDEMLLSYLQAEARRVAHRIEEKKKSK